MELVPARLGLLRYSSSQYNHHLLADSLGPVGDDEGITQIAGTLNGL